MYVSKSSAYQYDFVYDPFTNEVITVYYDSKGSTIPFRKVLATSNDGGGLVDVGDIAYGIAVSQNDNFNRWFHQTIGMPCKAVRIINQVPKLAYWLFKHVSDGYGYRNATYLEIENSNSEQLMNLVLKRIRWDCYGMQLSGKDIIDICHGLDSLVKHHMPFQRFQIGDRVVIRNEEAHAGPSFRREFFYGLHGTIDAYDKKTNCYCMVADNKPSGFIGWLPSDYFEFESKW